MSMHTYAAIFKQSTDGMWGGYAPDLATIVVNGDTLEEAKENMRTGIEFWIASMREDGLPIPEPNSVVASFEVTA